MAYLILSKKEIKRISEFANKCDENIVLHFSPTSIGTEYALQTQSDMIADKKNLEFITDWENW